MQIVFKGSPPHLKPSEARQFKVLYIKNHKSKVLEQINTYLTTFFAASKCQK